MTYALADADQDWRDRQMEMDEARAGYHRDRAAEEPVGCGCPQWCEFYMVSIGAPGCGETFPRCELMRDLRGTI